MDQRILAMFHEKLKLLRKAKKLSQEEVAQIFNMSQNCYSKIETGKTKLDQSRLIEFAKFYGIKPEELLVIKAVNLEITEFLQTEKKEHVFMMEMPENVKQMFIDQSNLIKILLDQLEETKRKAFNNLNKDEGIF